MATLEAFDPAQPIEVSCRKFGEFLGLNTPVSPEVLLGAIADPLYAHHLMVSRSTPVFLEHLLTHPPAPKGTGQTLPGSTVSSVAEPEAAAVGEQQHAELSNAELLKKAATAVWRWSRTGFSEVDDETYKRRLAACAACEHIQDPPSKLLYRLATTSAVDRKICGMCGCVVTRKAKIPSERCPAAHVSDPSLNRWGEPMATKQAHAEAQSTALV